jgi:predicted ArsR family transcriptional regulator
MTPEDMFAKRWAELAKAEGHYPKHKHKVEPDVPVSEETLKRVLASLTKPRSKRSISETVGVTENHVRHALRKLEKAGKVVLVAEPRPTTGRMKPEKWKLTSLPSAQLGLPQTALTAIIKKEIKNVKR